MKTSTTIAGLIVAVFCFEYAEQSHAQGFGAAQVRRFTAGSSINRFTTDRIRGRINNQSYGVVGVQGVNARTFGNAFSGVSSGSKPFKGLNRGPSVSPYLALSAPRASASE